MKKITIPTFESFKYYFLEDLNGTRPWLLPHKPYHVHPNSTDQDFIGFTYTHNYMKKDVYSMSGHLDIKEYGKTWKAIRIPE